MDFIIPIFIYVIVPIIGVIVFLITFKKYKPIDGIERFFLRLGICFACLGGVLLLLLTTLFWQWSGLASIGSVFLILIAPIIMTTIGIRSSKKSNISSEALLLKLSKLFFVLLAVTIATAIILES